MAHVLLIDDEPVLRTSLAFTLRNEGHTVTTAADGAAGLRLALEQPPDLVLLDLMLPGLDGVEVCRKLRLQSDVPILMLTARDQEDDKVLGLRCGADDYVTKPFSSRELAARVDALLRRPRSAQPGGPAAQPEVLEVGPFRMDVPRHEVRKSGRLLELTPKEFQLLHAFMSHPGRVLSRDELIRSVWGDDFMGDPKTLDVHVRWLRGKIEEDPGDPDHLVTVRGFGYRFE